MILQDDPSTPGYHVSPGDDDEHPKQDFGENFIFTVLALPFRVTLAPIRILAAIVSARQIDQETARRGVLDGEENAEIVEEVIEEHGRRIFRRKW